MVSQEQFLRRKHWKHALNAIEQKLDYAIDIDVPDENIINRMSGRRACVGCGATYHVRVQSYKG